MINTLLCASTGSDFAPGCVAMFAGFYIFIWLFIASLSILFLIFKILMLIDCARKSFKSSTEQVIWLLVLLLVPLGSIVYFLAVKYPDDESPGLTPRKM